MTASSPHLRISVITPSFNSGATLRETIESVLAQGDSVHEHIVMDGGSTDSTQSILNAFPHLKCFSENDSGLYDAMNRGIAHAGGDLIVILNADDCFLPGACSAVLAAFRDHPEWDACFGDFVFVDVHGGEIMRRVEARYDFNVLLYALDYICHHTLFVRKTAYERIGGYKFEAYPTIADHEFKLRLGRRGCRIGHIPRFMVNYRIHPGQVSATRSGQTQEELHRLRLEYGNPCGVQGLLLGFCYRLKRQFQKLAHRGRIDILPGGWNIRRHRAAAPNTPAPFNHS